MDELREEIEFQPRQMPAGVFEKVPFAFYIAFLIYFFVLVVGTNPLNDSFYQFAQYGRDAVSLDDFMRITNREEYVEWFDVHLLSGFAEASVGREANSPFQLVGGPRIRQARASNSECANPAFVPANSVDDEQAAGATATAAAAAAEGEEEEDHSDPTGCYSRKENQQPFGEEGAWAAPGAGRGPFEARTAPRS